MSNTNPTQSHLIKMYQCSGPYTQLDIMHLQSYCDTLLVCAYTSQKKPKNQKKDKQQQQKFLFNNFS